MTDSFFEIELLRKYPFRMMWNFSKSCNFHCPYCYNYPDKYNNPKEITEKHPSEFISGCFDKTGFSCLILFSGGEPFLVRDFLPLIRMLSQKHHLQITTNMCSGDIYRLPEFVKPDRVMAISASLHATERERDDPGFVHFIEKCLFLEQHGFRVLVNYVAWPPLLSRIENDFALLRSKGIRNMTVLSFRGTFNNMGYPGSYTEKELRIIENSAIDKAESDIARSNTNYKGMYCNAGHSFFSMDADGNITQCGTVNKAHGNLFDGSFRMNSSAKPCPARECIDCYLGMVSLTEKPTLEKRLRQYFRCR